MKNKSILAKLRDPAIGGPVAGGLVLLAIAVAVWNLMPATDPDVVTKTYYYDLQSKKIFIDKPYPDLVAPIKAPSGGEGVVAYVYTCGKCAESEWFVVYIEKYSDEFKAEQLKPKEQRDRAILLSGRRVKRVEDADWISTENPLSSPILNTDKCPGTLKNCMP